MNRKFRELIPLFAIGLMIIGAIALLVAMNSDGNKKKTQLKNENKTETKVEESKDELSKPVASIDDKKEETEDKKDTEVENKENKEDKNNVSNTVNTTVSTNTNKYYIQSMVDELLGTSNSSNMFNNVTNQGTSSNNSNTISKTEEVNDKNNTTTNSNTNTNTNNNSTSNTSKPVVSKPQTTQTITQSKVQKAKATAYTLLKSVNVGGYTVSTTSSNNIISYNSGNKVIVSVLNSGDVGLLKVFNNYIYAYETKSGLLKTYSLNTGALSLVSKVDMGSCKDFVITNNLSNS